MGKGFHNYMSKKFFHPGSFENIKKVWIAQQKATHKKQTEEETLAQYQKEQEMYQVVSLGLHIVLHSDFNYVLFCVRFEKSLQKLDVSYSSHQVV